MSRRERKELARRAGEGAIGTALPGEPRVKAVDYTYPGGWMWGGSGYDGANTSASRGYVYFPQMDTRRDLDTYSRMEMIRRSRYLDANVGLAGRVNDGLASIVAGTGLMPLPKTLDTEWNRDRAALFEERNGSSGVFDLGGRWDFYSAQCGMERCRNRDGDIGAILTSSAAGLARLAFVEGHRIGNGVALTAAEAKAMFDGVLVDGNNAAISYRVLGDGDSQADVPVSNFLYLGNYSSPGKNRTPPTCHRAINHMLDRTELHGAFKNIIKSSSRIGYYIGKEAGSAPRPPGLPVGVAPRVKVTLNDGKKIDIEKVIAQGGEMPDLDPGHEIKMLLDTRPHPNTLGFLEEMMRDISWGVGLSPDLLWNIAKLGGANTRYVMAEAQTFIDIRQQNLVDRVLSRYYFYDTRKEINSGRLRECQDPKWWQVSWIPPRRMTVDIGRDGKLYLEQVRSGALTFRRMLGWDGLESEHELREWLNEMKMISDEAKLRGLDVDKTLDRIYGRPGAAPAGGNPSGDPNADPNADPSADPNADPNAP